MGNQAHQEPEVTLDSIDRALGELVKAADATEMVKSLGGIAIDQGGHTDERGSTSGGYPEQGDVGQLDSMMIGKMAQALVDAGFDAGSIAAFMRGKQKGDDEDEEGGDDDMPFGKFGKPADTSGGVGTNGRPKPSGGEGTRKSMDAYQQDEQIAKALDVSPFLQAFIQRTAEQFDALNKSLSDRFEHQDEVTKRSAAALFGMGQLVKSIASVTQALDARLKLVERTPMPGKGHTQLTGARPLHKGLPREAGGPPAQGEPLSKAEVLSTLSYMNLEKGMREIGGQSTSEIIGLYEGGNHLSQSAFNAVVGFLSSHPNEAATARRYR